MKQLIILSFFFFLNSLIVKAQYPTFGLFNMEQPYIIGTIITEDSIIKDCYINEYFLAHQYIDYKLDSTQKETETISLTKVTKVIISKKTYYKIAGIKGGYGTYQKLDKTSSHSTGQMTVTTTKYGGTGTALTYGTWLINFLIEGKWSLGETLIQPISKDLMKMQKDRYVRPAIFHIIKGDKNDRKNYVSILGAKKYKKKKLKSCFEGYPEILKMIDEMDFSKRGYVQKTIDQFIAVVNKYNSLQE